MDDGPDGDFEPTGVRARRHRRSATRAMCRDSAGCRWRPLRLICWPPCSFIGASGDARCAHSRPAAGGEAREARRSYTSSGVERTDQALIDAAGKRLLREVLEPLGWVLNETQAGSDYAIDFDVEVFEKQKSTGTIFKVQLKSSASSDYSAAGDFVSQAITVRHARRFVSEIDAPVVLVHADTTNRRIFWFAPQLDGGLPTVLQGKADDAKVVVRILTSNPLPQTVARLRASIAEMQTNLAFRYLSRAAHPEFLAVVLKSDRLDDGMSHEVRGLVGREEDPLDVLHLSRSNSAADQKRRRLSQVELEEVEDQVAGLLDRDDRIGVGQEHAVT